MANVSIQLKEKEGIDQPYDRICVKVGESNDNFSTLEVPYSLDVLHQGDFRRLSINSWKGTLSRVSDIAAEHAVEPHEILSELAGYLIACLLYTSDAADE